MTPRSSSAPCFCCDLLAQVLSGSPDAHAVRELFEHFSGANAPMHELVASLCAEHIVSIEEMIDQVTVALDHERAQRARRQLRLVTED